MDYCCQVWESAPSCYLDILDKLQKRVYKTVGPALGTSLVPSSEMAELVPLPCTRGRSIRYSDRLHDFSVTPFLDVTTMSMSTVSFLAQLDPGILYL